MRLGRFVCGLVLAVSPAAHAGISNVMLVVVPQDDAATAQALSSQTALQAMLAHDDRLEVIAPVARYAPEDVAAAEKQASAGRVALEEISGLLARVDYEGAQAKAEQALSSLRGGDFRAVREPYVQLLMQLARIKQALRVDDSGASELAQALAVDPDGAPLRGLNSEERKGFDAAKALAAVAAKASPVTVDSDVRGWLWIDGRFRGITPLTVSDLVAGRHFVTFLAPGGRATSQTELFGSIARLSVSSPATSEGRTFRALAASLSAAMSKAQPDAAARELLSWAKVDELIAVGLSSSGTATLVRVTTSGASRRELQASSNDALVSAIRALFDGPLKSDVVVAVSASAPATSSAPVTVETRGSSRKVPGWILIGTGVAAAVVGGVLLATAQSQFQTAGTIPQVEDDKYKSAVSNANGLAGGGFGMLGAGIAAAGVGVLLVW